jgi:hypothetical protein
MEEGPGSIVPCGEDGVGGGVWQPARRAVSGGGGRSGICRVSRGAGRHAWAMCVGVGRPEKGGRWARPESNNANFDLKRISKLNTI